MFLACRFVSTVQTIQSSLFHFPTPKYLFYAFCFSVLKHCSTPEFFYAVLFLLLFCFPHYIEVWTQTCVYPYVCEWCSLYKLEYLDIASWRYSNTEATSHRTVLCLLFICFQYLQFYLFWHFVLLFAFWLVGGMCVWCFLG